MKCLEPKDSLPFELTCQRVFKFICLDFSGQQFKSLRVLRCYLVQFVLAQVNMHAFTEFIGIATKQE